MHQLLAVQDGVITRTQMRAAGCSASALARLVARGVLIRMHAGVYRHAAFALTPALKLRAAVLAAGRGGAVTHRAAVESWGLHGYRAFVIEVSRPGGRLSLKDVIVHGARDLRPEHVTYRDGLEITTPARTLVDLGAVLPGLVERCMEEWLADKIVSFVEIERLLADLGGHGRRGVGVLRSAFEARALGASIADSGWEARLARVLAAHGVPAPVHHHRVLRAGAVVAELDYAYPRQRIALEVDGYGVHLRSRTAFERDRVRQNALEIDGWRFLRFTADRIRRQPAGVAREVARMLAATTAAIAA